MSVRARARVRVNVGFGFYDIKCVLGLAFDTLFCIKRDTEDVRVTYDS